LSRLYFIFFLLLLTFGSSSFAQLSPADRKLLKTANNLFDDEQFAKALPIFLKIDSIDNDLLVTYRIGACYLNSKFEKLKALPFLEEVSQVKAIEVPLIVYNDLGTLYHYMYRFDDAISMFEKYLEASKKDEFAEKKDIEYAKRMIVVCKNAIEITTKPFNADIDILEPPINTMESEFCPMISADEQILVYMQTIGIGKIENPETLIMISFRTPDGDWGIPSRIEIPTLDKYKGKSVLLAGLSPDGQTIFLNIGQRLDQDIYSGTLSGKTVSDLKKLNKNINTSFFDGRVSISADGTVLYFVSDRPGGFGGTDIYKSIRTKRGDWGEPVNLGGKINTQFNEDSPFIHPDNVTLYFSSEGHKTIGGNDIFKSKFDNKDWSEPENVGFLNSTKDDLYFVLNANGQIGYFSSSKNNVFDKHNIFKVNLKDPIPLTLVKGVIKGGIPPMPIGADIKVFDKETGERVKYVYNPDPETGKYLMIFPPAKNYDVFIGSKDFLPQLINIYIPYQTYFYELYQEILLQPVKLENGVVGEVVTVNNTFYDLYKTIEADSILLEDMPKQPQYYEHLLELVENIIQTTDSMRINYRKQDEVSQKDSQNIDVLLNLIEEAIETSDPVTLNILDANASQKDKIKQTHFYVDGNKNKSLVPYIIGGDTLYCAPAIKTPSSQTEYEKLQEKMAKSDNFSENRFRTSQAKDRKYIHRFVVNYQVNQDEIPDSKIPEINDICRLLIDNPSLGAEIYGYTDAQGAEKYNLSLSRQRAQKVLRFFIDHKVEYQRLIAKGFGEANISDKNLDPEHLRRVEINVFELKE
jgi:outer membrane protein OmpA-like peptidoglycan-associated protein